MRSLKIATRKSALAQWQADAVIRLLAATTGAACEKVLISTTGDQLLGVTLENVLDLGEILRGPGHRGMVGAKVAVAHFFGKKLQKSKKTGTSNWANPRLTERQMLYAANDAHVALRLYRAWLVSRKQ